MSRFLRQSAQVMAAKQIDCFGPLKLHRVIDSQPLVLFLCRHTGDASVITAAHYGYQLLASTF